MLLLLWSEDACPLAEWAKIAKSGKQRIPDEFGAVGHTSHELREGFVDLERHHAMRFAHSSKIV